MAVDTVVGTGGGGGADADAATTAAAQMPRHSDDDCCRPSSTMSTMRDNGSKGSWRTRASWFLGGLDKMRRCYYYEMRVPLPALSG